MDEAGNDKNTAPIDGEIVVSDTVLPKAVMTSPKQLEKQMVRDEQVRAVIDKYIKGNMVEGKDYGSINIKGAQSKPSLFKPGAEKFCGLFKIRPVFKKDNETVEMLGDKPGIIAYICELVDGRGQVIGEGRGSSSVNPAAPDFDVNKAIKIAEKRAQIDAVLRTGALSDFFTQDMEDAPRTAPSSAGPKDYGDRPVPAASPKQQDLIAKLAKERFESTADFEEFAKDEVGVSKDFDLKQASKLIGKLFSVPKMEGDQDENY